MAELADAQDLESCVYTCRFKSCQQHHYPAKAAGHYFLRIFMSKIVALTGVTGAMGGEVLFSLMQSDMNLKVNCVVFDRERKIPSFVKKRSKNTGTELIIFGAISQSLTTALSLSKARTTL